MEFTREERRRILRSQSRAANRELRAYGRKLFIRLEGVALVLALYGFFEAEDSTLRAVCVAVAVAAAAGLLGTKRARTFIRAWLPAASAAAAGLLRRSGGKRLTGTAPAKPAPPSPDATDATASPSFSVAAAESRPARLSAERAPQPALAAPQAPEDAVGARPAEPAARPAKARSDAVTWILFAVICLAIVLAVVAAAIFLGGRHPALPR